MIRVENLFCRYPADKSPVLAGISLAIGAGEYCALIGPNGSGKTTLGRHLNALLIPTSGTVTIDDLDTKDTARVGEIRRRVGMVFQNPDSQIVGMTVEEDIAFGPGNLRLPPAQVRERVDQALADAGIAHLARRNPQTLSGGEKRLLAIAGVLAMAPSYLILDEPTAYLDPAGRQRILGMVRTLNDRGMTVIHIAHDLDDVADARRLVVLAEGRLILDGPPQEVHTQYGILRSVGLDVPQITELMHRLHSAGCDVPTNVLTVEEACRELAARIPRNDTAGLRARPPAEVADNG